MQIQEAYPGTEQPSPTRTIFNAVTEALPCPNEENIDAIIAALGMISSVVIMAIHEEATRRNVARRFAATIIEAVDGRVGWVERQ